MKQKPVPVFQDFFRGFFDMVVAGRQDYPDMTKALLC